jgi:hypothetical protein
VSLQSTTFSLHDQELAHVVQAVPAAGSDLQFVYTFENFFHPFAGELIAKLNRDSLRGMLDADWQKILEQLFFAALYGPSSNASVEVNSFPKQIDLAYGGPYSNYNWELLFHVPFTVAAHLSKSRRFPEAQRWFHYIFDPTATESWRFLGFRESDGTMIDTVLALLSTPKDQLSPADQTAQDRAMQGYAAILNKPFQPHAVARTRPLAYQYSVVMKYLDNLIAWGDDLFQQDTIESINEATQLYVLAANILGERPQEIPARGAAGAKTFAQLKAEGLGPMGNALVELEAQFPFNLSLPSSNGSSSEGAGPLFGIGRTLYFCLPRNDKLLGYWDKVADRLFKIRHCMNIAGVVRPLALFDPPIDPGLLVKAAAAGIDVSGIVSGLTEPVGPMRSLFLIQKALELSSEVRSMGNALLSALEKGDAEHLALVRQRHEIEIQQATQDIRFLQWKSAEQATASLFASRDSMLGRFNYYRTLLGLQADSNFPDPDDPGTQAAVPDRQSLSEETFDTTYKTLVTDYDTKPTLQQLSSLKSAALTSPAQQSGAAGQSGLGLSAHEDEALSLHGIARDMFWPSIAADTIAAGLVWVPYKVGTRLHFWGIGADVDQPVGRALIHGAELTSRILKAAAEWQAKQAGVAGQQATYERRAAEWLLQYSLAAHELQQNGRQIIGSLIAEQIAEHEYEITKHQIDNAREIDTILRTKFTNEDLYAWSQGEISRLYYEYYRFAYDTAKRAERAMKLELMRPELDAQDFVQFNYWDGGRKGLLTGEALYLDVKRMETAYHESNTRELELTKNVSLRQLDPLALLTLKTTGTCTVTIAEWLYDLDCPGHYIRRIKNVALSIPSVVGPYTNVHCTLSLLNSSIRKSAALADGEYARQGSDDDRFVDYSGAVQSIVTSGAANDSGLFETSLRDERYLPFEGAGAVSTWKLDLPTDYPTFDYSTISDVILHVRYTARQGVDATKVASTLADLFQAADQTGFGLLFSLPHDFPTEWSAFVNGTGDFTATIKRDYFPYFAQGKKVTIAGLELYDGTDVSKHESIADQAALDAATADLADGSKQAFAFTAKPGGILTRSTDATPFLLIGYSLA